MKKDDLSSCKKSDDFIKYAEKRGAAIRSGHGSHVVICTEKGSCPIPRHGNQELSKGMRHQICKVFAMLGLAIIVISIWIWMV